MVIRRVAQAEAELLRGLGALLQESVNGGASIGFLAPLSAGDAGEYWRGVFRALGADLILWVAEQDGKVVGTVQLALCGKPNGQHRAEVQKLMVLSAFRKQGIASHLMQEMEAFARANRRTLLYLDTQAGSGAESLYQSLGWQKAGEIPHFAPSPDGVLLATAIYFKEL